MTFNYNLVSLNFEYKKKKSIIILKKEIGYNTKWEQDLDLICKNKNKKKNGWDERWNIADRSRGLELDHGGSRHTYIYSSSKPKLFYYFLI